MSMEHLKASQPNGSLSQNEISSRLNHDSTGLGGADSSNGLGSQTPVRSEAATFNLRVLKKLQKAYESDPEVNLQLLFPENYSDRLEARIKDNEQNGDPPAQSWPDLEQRGPNQTQDATDHDIRSRLDPDYSVEVMYPLSPSTRDIIASYQHIDEKEDLREGVIKMLATSEVIHRGPTPASSVVFRCSPNAVVKVIWNAEDYTEYTMLQFLSEQAPDVPAPKPLGVLKIGRLSLIFESYIPGQQLSEVWSNLTPQQKNSLMAELELILRNLRSISCPQNQPLGGVAGEGCKDLRRHVRRNSSPIYTVAEHDNFLFSKALFGSETYLNLLRSLATDEPAKICLSHGDIRPDNIIVQQKENSFFTISGLVDWEFGGYYPSHYESTKATNCLGTDEMSDWYSYLPPCISPSRQAQRWLLDYVMGWLLE
ncbi:hypothetical protein A1O3_06125 [Capronia epimyces CBS 606.96]|uniref:Aminoglycoside phosphotransferase domain-containing protein n=1 Tax=Capronia epimyces CBS 606.96 TaxID=1182542 RepID=W9XP43_9EURO|nr:uncharacterized protein A1O3_06125 [Capronia epimyces CBS 606.96]EXJ82312.1 hypothetical protein A1O3_06125 [Capronia epimyces CBS 606.96]